MPYVIDSQAVANQDPRTNVGSGIGSVPTKKKTLAEQIAELNAKNTGVGTTTPDFQSYSADYGSLDSAFQKVQDSYAQMRASAESQYGADKARQETDLAGTMRDIAGTKETVKEGFASGRKQIATESFMADRTNQANMASRGLTGSGIQALTTIQNRMSAGENISDLSNDFFKAQEQLVNAEVDAKNNYNNSLNSLGANLQNTLSSIMNGQASNEMAYRQQVETLKQSVIESANNAKAMQYQYEQARQELEDGKKITNTMVQQALESETTDEFKIMALQDMGFSATEAEQTVNDHKTNKATSDQKAIQDWVNQQVALKVPKADILATLAKDPISSSIDIKKLSFTGTSPSETSSQGTKDTSKMTYNQKTAYENSKNMAGLAQAGVNGVWGLLPTQVKDYMNSTANMDVGSTIKNIIDAYKNQ